jgi:hypothetical protein
MSFDELGQDSISEFEPSNKEDSDSKFCISDIPQEEEYITYLNEAILPKKVRPIIQIYLYNYLEANI